MSLLSRITLFVAFLSFAAGPTALGAVTTHCADFDLHSTQLQSESNESLVSVEDSDLSPEVPMQTQPVQKHVHCNPIACHFTVPSEVMLITYKSSFNVGIAPVTELCDVHLESLPRPPSC